MIDRYALPQMKAIWDDKARFQRMLDVEICAAEVMAELGYIPEGAIKNIKEKAVIDTERISQIEELMRHEVLAFLSALSEGIGDDAKYLHLGLSACDVLDTALALQMRDSIELLEASLRILRDTLKKRAAEYKYTIMVGRTHGMHTEPLTFGLKLAGWSVECERHIKRLAEAKAAVAVGMISGAVGTYATVEPRVEESVCRLLHLSPATISSQIIPRDGHAQFVATMAIIGGSIEKMATEIRNLQRTEIAEVAEDYSKEQMGASAMPFKKNPVLSERISGLARILRGNAIAAMEDIALWHERDMTHSSVERVVIPDSCILLHYMIDTMTKILKGLVVNEEQMRSNMDKTLGLVFSQRVVVALVDRGMSKDRATYLVQRNSYESWGNSVDFEYLISADEDIMEVLTDEDLRKIFDYNYYLRHVDYLFNRAGIRED